VASAVAQVCSLGPFEDIQGSFENLKGSFLNLQGSFENLYREKEAVVFKSGAGMYMGLF